MLTIHSLHNPTTGKTSHTLTVELAGSRAYLTVRRGDGRITGVPMAMCTLGHDEAQQLSAVLAAVRDPRV